MASEIETQLRTVILPKVREDTGLTEYLYPDWFVLAVADYQSGLDPDFSVNNNTSAGLFGIDERKAALVNNSKPVDYVGKPSEAVTAFLQYMESYAEIHGYNYEAMALLWGTRDDVVATYLDIKLIGDGDAAADEYLNTVWGNGAVFTYMQRMRANMSKWSNNAEQFVSVAQTLPSGAVNTPPSAYRLPLCNRSAGDFSVWGVQGGEVGAEAAVEVRRVSAARTKKIQIDIQAFTTRYEATFDGLRVNEANAASTRIIDYILNDDSVKTFTLSVDDNKALGLVWPLTTIQVLSPFQKRRTKAVSTGNAGAERLGIDPVTGQQRVRLHKGVDFLTQNNPNQPVYAIADGVVVRADVSESYGLVVYIDHNNGFSSRYAHMSKFFVKTGDRVTRAQPIGLAGITQGRKSGGKVLPHNSVRTPHLHFEILVQRQLIQGRPLESNRLTAVGNANSYRIDPIAMLVNSPLPTDPYVSPTSPINKVMNSVAESREDATSPSQYAVLGSMYDITSGLMRDEALANVTRKQVYDTASLNYPEVRKRIEKSYDVRYGDAPLGD
jgi:murein DD-endopeptidase MepM/ murein hydrolase activator NlpD